MPPSGHGRDQEWIVSNDLLGFVPRSTIAARSPGYASRISQMTLAALDACLLATLTTACAGGSAPLLTNAAGIVTRSIPLKLALLLSSGASGRVVAEVGERR
jgi:hypothetical protein